MRKLQRVIPAKKNRLPAMFWDVGATYKDMGSYYDTAGDQTDGLWKLIFELHSMDRDVLLAASLDDRLSQASIVAIIKHLLKDGSDYDYTKRAALDWEGERKVLRILRDRLQITRLYRIFDWLIANRINNARVRWFINDSVTATITPYRAVKYHHKLQAALRHSMGLQRFSWAQGKALTLADVRNLMRINSISANKLYSLEFVIKHGSDMAKEIDWPEGILKDYFAANSDPRKLLNLPLEVASGKRSLPGNEVDMKVLYKAGQMSASQTTRLKKAAAKHEVKIEIAKNASFTDILINFFNTCDPELSDELKRRRPNGKKEWISVVDASPSMRKGGEQNWRRFAETVSKAYESGKVYFTQNKVCQSETIGKNADSLAHILALAAMMNSNAKIIFVFTDGYEHDGGLTSQVASVIEKNNIKVIQVSNVSDSKSNSVRIMFGPERYLAMSDNGNIRQAIARQEYEEMILERPWIYLEQLLTDNNIVSPQLLEMK